LAGAPKSGAYFDGKGWFVYFRIDGPEPPAFESSWKLDDFEPVP
jgi:hypothetical protein